MKQKVKKVTKTMMALIITFSILLVSLIGLTVAYFTDNKSYTGTLEFGNVKLKVTDGSDVEMTDGGKIPFTFGEGREDATKLMPGDTVTINFKVSLQDSSEPAYYLVSLTDTKGVFASNTYFSDGTKTGDVLNIYVNDGTKTYLQSDSTQTALTTENMKYVGTLSGTEQHEFTIKAEIDPAYETQGGKTEVSLNIFAIQQANLEKYDENNTDKSAYHILTNKVNLAVNGVTLPATFSSSDGPSNGIQKVFTASTITDLGFYKTGDSALANFEESAELTAKLDAELTSQYGENAQTGLIKVYKESSKESYAFVSDYKINAPEDSLYFFTLCSKLTNINLSNFDTSKVTNMSSMFAYCSSLTSLDVSNFDTSKVTDMGDMFDGCSSLTTLDVSKFDTSKVTNMYMMFYDCSSLTSLDVSNFDTSKVTNMSSMFTYCSSLTSLDLSNFDTSKVTNFAEMFNNTFKNSPSTSTLTISDKFVIDGSNTFDKATLNTKTKFNTTVTLKRGTETVA